MLALPLFIETIMFIIDCTPSKLRWLLLYIKSMVSLNNKKVILFTVKRGYLVKCGIITYFNSLIELTVYTAWPFSLSLCILPTPLKKFCILYNKSKSLSFNYIAKAGIN